MKSSWKIGLLALGCGICSTMVIHAQDVQRYSERGIIGSARYVGMGGAMTAIGGDPSAAMDNPAGLGLYRRSEIGLSGDIGIDITQPVSIHDTNTRSHLGIPQVSAIWASHRSDRQKGLIYSNIMVAFNQLASYHRDIEVSGSNTGMVPTLCTLTSGLAESALGQEDVWYDEEIGWMTILGYDTYLIDPATNNEWLPAVNLSDGQLSINEKGSSYEYSIAWAGNISNQWYIGASINVPTLTYSKQASLLEHNAKDRAHLSSYLHVSGVGVKASVGMIARPTEWLRIGASLHTPTVMHLSVYTEGEMSSKVAENEYKAYTPLDGRSEARIPTPLRSSIGIAGQWKHIGMLSIQYDYAHALREKNTGESPMVDMHTLRAGIEAQILSGVYLNAGYVYESPFLERDPVVGLSYNSIRTDIDYRYTQSTQYASAGVGYRNENMVAHLSYQYGWQLLHQYASEHQVDAMLINTRMHRIVCTLAWRI